MESGFINLKPILGHIKIHPKVPKGKKEFRGYSEICDKILSKVPEIQGWYFWGRLDNWKKWKHIYIGMAGYKKIKLHGRIKEELKDERVAFWADIWGRRRTIKSHNQRYPGKYQWEMERALEKRGTKYIIWVSDKSAVPKEVKNEESVLIQKLNPSANRDHPGNSRPTKKTSVIKRFLEREIGKIIGQQKLEK